MNYKNEKILLAPAHTNFILLYYKKSISPKSHKSTLIIQNSSLNIKHSLFNIQNSSFTIKHSKLNIQNSTFIIQLSSFNTQHSTLKLTTQNTSHLWTSAFRTRKIFFEQFFSKHLTFPIKRFSFAIKVGNCGWSSQNSPNNKKLGIRRYV